MALSVIVTIAGLRLFRRVLNSNKLKHEEAVVGYIFSAIALIYAVVLAFVVFAVWERYSASQQVVTGEAASLVVAYRDTETFADPMRVEAQKLFNDYAHFVMDHEWTTHGTVLPHTKPDALNQLWAKYRQANASDSAMDRLHDLEQQRLAPSSRRGQPSDCILATANWRRAYYHRLLLLFCYA